MYIDTTNTRAGENYLTIPEEKQLFDYLKQLKGTNPERDYVLLLTMRLLGLRRIEVVRLNVGNVYGKDKLVVDERIAAKGSVGVLNIPSNKQKPHTDLQRFLVEFMRRKRQWGESVDDDAPLFVSRNGNRLSTRAVNDILDKWQAAAGLKHRITVHGLRHTKAQRIVRDERYLTTGQRNNALGLAQKQLRHKNPASTSIYTAPSREDMAAAAEL